MFSVLFDFLIVTVLGFIVGTLLLSSESRSWVEEGPSCLWMAAGSCRLPALPQLGRSQWRRPTTLDSSSFASGFLGTTALTFPPTHFCFLKDCVQELFCCFHFTLPIKVFLKSGWAAFILLKSSALWFGRIVVPTPSDGGGNICGGDWSAGYFSTWGNVALIVFSATDLWVTNVRLQSKLDSEFSWEQDSMQGNRSGSKYCLTAF